MADTDRESLIAICHMAALADDQRPPAEQEQLARIVSRLGGQDPAPVSERVQAGQITLEGAAAALSSEESRRLAYQLAVSVVYADGEASPAEGAFLDRLRDRLDLARVEEPPDREARALATASLSGPVPPPDAGPRHPHEGPRPSQAGIPAVSQDAATDHMIRQQALIAGALELLPQSIATLAIIPIQLRLVYRIGADFGQKLDADQIKDLLGAMGIGTAAQVLDAAVRRVLGRVAGMLTGAGVAFVTTYALGHAAKQYYAQGRRLSRADLRALFDRLRTDAERLLPAARTEMQEVAQRLDLSRLLSSLRGG